MRTTWKRWKDVGSEPERLDGHERGETHLEEIVEVGALAHREYFKTLMCSKRKENYVLEERKRRGGRCGGRCW